MGLSGGEMLLGGRCGLSLNGWRWGRDGEAMRWLLLGGVDGIYWWFLGFFRRIFYFW